MADDDNFEKITNGFNEGEQAAPETAWEAVNMFWPTIMGSGLPVKGVFIVEYATDTGREFYFSTNDEAESWDIKGLLTHAQDIMKDEGTLGGVYQVVNHIMNDDEEDNKEGGE